MLLIRTYLYSWLVGSLKKHSRPGYERRLFTAMVRSRLCDLLMSLDDHAPEANGAGTRGDRLRRNLALASAHRRSLGLPFTALLLLSSLSKRLASALSRRTFAFFRAVHERGSPSAMKTLVC
jgi:hypothetical protein